MKRLLLIAQLLFPAVTWAQVIANAGPDKISSPGKPVVIGTPGDGKSCYHWVSNPEDPRLTNRNSPQVQVNPSVPTVYTLTVTAADFSAQSTDNVTVGVFYIKYLRFNSNYTWKVVHGFPMEYSATSTMEGATNWNWTLGDWQITGGNAANGIMEWAPVEELPRSNNAFGETNGAVTVSCNGPDGTLYTAGTLEFKPPLKAQVFYNRGGLNNPTFIYPNWYYYWTEMLDRSTLKISGFDYYADLPGRYAETNLFTRITTFALVASRINNLTGHTGVHCFIEMLAHENEHLVIHDGFWPDGYKEELDKDSDLFPDTWEISTGVDLGFMVGVNDTANWRAGYPGYDYIEQICHQAEFDAEYDAYDHKDWSYDPTNGFQGKQWEK